MRLLLLFFLVLGVMLAVVACVPACPPVYHANVVKAVEVVKVVEVVTPVFVPTFSVAYTPYAPPAPPPPPGPSNADVLRALQALGQRLDGIERTRAVPAPNKVMPPASDPANSGPQSSAPRAAQGTALAVYQAKCAACHQQGQEAKGGNFVLLDAGGQLARLSDRQRGKMLSLTYSGKMPPRDNGLKIPGLTDEELTLIVASLGEAKE